MAPGRWADERLPVPMTTAVALLAIVTGLAKTGQILSITPPVQLVPAHVQRLSALTGTVTGFVLLVAAWGLSRRLIVGWLLAVLFVPLTAFQAFLQSDVLSLPLFVLSIVTTWVLLRQRGRFDRRRTVSVTQRIVGGLFLLILAYGTVGAYLLRQHFVGIQTPLDALYYTIVTATTVGYGDVVPITSLGRSFGLTVILTGVVGLGLVGGAILSPFLESRVDRALGHMSRATREQLDGHIILLGYSDVTSAILSELHDQADAVVVTSDETDASSLTEHDVMVYVADTGDEAALQAVRVDAARAVFVATGSDATDALGVLTTRQADPDVKIVATARDPENVSKFKRAGANVVISLSSVLGTLMVKAALTDLDAEGIAERIIAELGADGDRSP